MARINAILPNSEQIVLDHAYGAWHVETVRNCRRVWNSKRKSKPGMAEALEIYRAGIEAGMIASATPRRMWVNQPSTLQPHHNLHGECMLVVPEPFSPDYVRAYFIDGDTVSKMMPLSAFSEGWRPT